MPSNADTPGVTKAAIQLNLTAAGWAVIAMIGAAVFLSASRRLAIGFLIPMAAAVAIDLFVSWQVLSRRTVSVTPTRTVVHQPDGIPLRIAATGPATPIRVLVSTRMGDEIVAVTSEAETLEWRAAHPWFIDHLRTNTSCSMFGLALAHRWQTHVVPVLHWAPAPRPERLTTPEAIDEVAHLREYVPGDRMSRVSWATTARTGRMHVRSAGAGHEEFTVVLNLGFTDGAVGESAAVAQAPGTAANNPTARPMVGVLNDTLEIAATLVSQLLEDGHNVRLLTTELSTEYLDTRRVAVIEDPRLTPKELDPADFEPTVVDRFVTDDDDLARRLALAEVGPSLTPYGSYVEVSLLGIRTLP